MSALGSAIGDYSTPDAVVGFSLRGMTTNLLYIVLGRLGGVIGGVLG